MERKRLIIILAVIALVIVGIIGISSMLKKPEEVSAVAASEVRDPEITRMPAQEPDDVMTHEVEDVTLTGEKLFFNDKVMTAVTEDGKSLISVGLNKGTKDDYIYLNISSDVSTNNLGEKLGYYVTADCGELFIANRDKAGDVNSDFNKDYSDFVILDRLYDYVVPSVYADAENYGIAFNNSLMYSPELTSATIRIRAFSLTGGMCYGIFYVDAAMNKETGEFSLENLRKAEALELELITAGERTQIVDAALAFAKENRGEKLPEGWEETAARSAIVDKVETTYFAKSLSVKDRPVVRKDFKTCKDGFAVTLNLQNYSYTTIYVAPTLEVIGLDNIDVFDEETTYSGYCYDPLFPRNANSLLAPIDF